MPNKMERFTEDARNVLSLAQEEAERLRHSAIGTEHLLLGLLRVEDGNAARVLRTLGLDRFHVEELLGRMNPGEYRAPNTRRELTLETKNVLTLAVVEARHLKHHYIGTEHLLLGIVQQQENGATDVLKRLNINLEEVRRETNKVLAESPDQSPPPEPSAAPADQQTAEPRQFKQTHHKLERFTVRARRVLALAQEEAERLQHSYIGTEHLLLGLMRENGGVAHRVFVDLGLDPRSVEILVERMTRAGQRTSTAQLDLSPGAKKVLELTVDEARRMGHHYIGTEHLLLGLVRQQEGIAVDVLKRLNVSPEDVRRQTRRVLQESPVQGRQQPPAPVTVTGEATSSHRVLQDVGQFPTRIADWRIALAGAYQEAKLLRHDYVGTEHLLLALTRDTSSVAPLLRSVLNIDRLSEWIKPAPTDQENPANDLSFTPELIAALGFATAEAFNLGNIYLRTEHLLLGLLHQEESPAIDILKKLEVSPETLQKMVRNVLKQ